MNSAITTKTPEQSALRKKWGVALDPGFLLIPNSLLMRQHELQLGDGDLVVLLHLLMAWWHEGAHPFPHPGTIAKRMNVSARTVQRHLSRLEELGLVTRIGASLRERVRYDVRGTVALLSELAAAMPTKPRHHLMSVTNQVESPF